MQIDIPYASAQTTRRWSKCAIAALLFSLLGPFLTYALLWLPRVYGDFVLVATMALCILGPFVLDLIAIVRLGIHKTLRCTPLVLTAFIPAIAWPVVCLYIVMHIRTC